MTANQRVNSCFSEYQKSLDAEQEIREVIRSICKETDQLSREIATVLQVIHHSEEEIGPACLQARQMFEKAREGYEKLKAAVPSIDYYRYYDHWRFMNQRYSFLITLTIWLEKGIMGEHEVVAQILGIDFMYPVKPKVEVRGFHLDVEDYLIGLLQLCSELARLAVNSVTRGDYHRPMQISKFVSDVNSGFRLLNLKNDHLRKRYDALKYDVKKIEEVVYDLSIRGLLKRSILNGVEGDADEVKPVIVEDVAREMEAAAISN